MKALQCSSNGWQERSRSFTGVVARTRFHEHDKGQRIYRFWPGTPQAYAVGTLLLQEASVDIQGSLVGNALHGLASQSNVHAIETKKEAELTGLLAQLSQGLLYPKRGNSVKEPSSSSNSFALGV